MLIYNFQKEFLGIDEKDLMALGYKNLSELKTEVSDFADLFVKTPGYIHNFKHVHWIDFITCAESYEESKVIINVNNKNYKSTLTISTTFLVDSPSQKAYIITLNNLRELTHQENEAIANDIIERPANNFEKEPKKIFNTAEYNEEFNEPQETENKNITIDPYETPVDIDTQESVETNEMSIDEIKIDIDLYKDDADETILESETIPEDEITLENNFEDTFTNETVDSVEITEEIVQENFDNGYTYNPLVASEELGLPLDLIEEFIQDFIAQAKEFKTKLYLALDEADLNNIQILSHKLKGVAANLRIEDALETLTIANTSSDFNVIKENLNIFYNIISKLAGEEINVTKEIKIKKEPIVDDTELSLSFKDDEDDLYSDPIEELKNSDIAQKIESIELTDDMFLQDQNEVEKSEDFSYSKETIANEIGLDIDNFNDLFQDYIQDSQILLNSMKLAIKEQDYKTSKAEGLRLKGMSDNMRIDSFLDALESIIHSSDSQTITQAISKIEAKLAQLSNLGV